MVNTSRYRHAVALISLIALGVAILLGIRNRTASSLAMCAVFFSSAVVSQLPFESIEAFNIEAQLQDRIDKADELIKQLRALRILTAKAGYTTTSLSTILGGMLAGYSLINDFNDLITSLQLSDSEVAQIKQPEYRAVAYRLYVSFFSFIAALPGADPTLTKGWSNKDLSALSTGYQSRLLAIDSGDDLRLILSAFAPDNMLPDQRRSLNNYIGRLVGIYEECVRAGGPTKRFIEFDHQATAVPNKASQVANAIAMGTDPD